MTLHNPRTAFLTEGADGDVIWIVYHDSSPDNNILGIFDNPRDARDYANQVKYHYPKGVLTSSFPIPWRSTDGGVDIQIPG